MKSRIIVCLPPGGLAERNGEDAKGSAWRNWRHRCRCAAESKQTAHKYIHAEATRVRQSLTAALAWESLAENHLLREAHGGGRGAPVSSGESDVRPPRVCGEPGSPADDRANHVSPSKKNGDERRF